MKAEPKQFDLNIRLPNVLLVGNGILTSCAKINNIQNDDWATHISNIAESKLTETKKEKYKAIPYSVQASIVAHKKDVDRQNSYDNEFKTLEFEDNSLLKELVSLGFDSILTTNYTYEIENCFYPNFSKLKSKNAYVKSIERVSDKQLPDKRFLLRTFNEFSDSPPIWHIHGEQRKKSSIVLIHDEYARLIRRLVEENAINKNKYVTFKDNVKYTSWLDYFLMSNLYIVGLSMDFSEFDLWWIINRRMRENGEVGKIVFFNTIYDDPKIEVALSEMDIEVKSFDIKAHDKSSYYIEFYKQVTEYIKNDLTVLKGEVK